MDKIETVRQWLAAKNRDVAVIASTDDLVERGWVNSVTFVEYILLIEEVTGREIEMNENLLGKVRTLDAVSTHFLTGEAS